MINKQDIKEIEELDKEALKQHSSEIHLPENAEEKDGRETYHQWN